MSRRQREDEEEEHPYPQTAPPTCGSLAQRDPPLSLATPTPSLMQGRPGSSFGFSPGGFVPPTDETMDTQGGVSQGDGIGGDLQDDREVPPAEVRTVNTPSYSYERSLAPDENNAEGSDHDVAPKARSTHTFKPPEDAKPTHLCYYHGTPWYDVLVSAKSFYRMSIHTKTSDPFPERSRESLGAAHDCLLEAIALLTTAEQASLNDTTYHVDHSNMTALIFDDGPSYRGRMKTMARDIVKSHFKAELNPSLTFGHNSSEQAQVISDAVRNTLQNSLFLVGPELDENGRTENFAHPAAIELCKMFYYSGKDCLSVLFPKEFSILPIACLIMAFTCIVNCLDEWESGYLVKVPFTGDAYGPRYSLIAGLADDVLGNAYHGKRLRVRLRKIAADGWVSNSKKRGSNSSGHSFKVTLD
ncbi:hypothetical protein EDB89DRAFT_2069955 [Lactarius sanguifluus]|nr:hypothetical protein EDB89DRAFT_2069955 [Lactarius sanguifluus]